MKKWKPLLWGFIISVPVYIIDAVIWFKTGVREYEIDGVSLIFPVDSTGITVYWLKFPIEFMMDISYSVLAFSWVWICFENWQERKIKEVVQWTSFLFSGWLLIPFISNIVKINDSSIRTVRYMENLIWVQILSVIIGYFVLIIFKYDLKTLLYVFWIGCMLAFMMEFSLWINGIRPMSIDVLIFDTLILTNSGVPYLYLLWDKIFPVLKRIIISRKAILV
ncbi:MAG: hypothetical protein ACTSWY_04895 [Promethearchaeota archaeon]